MNWCNFNSINSLNINGGVIVAIVDKEKRVIKSRTEIIKKYNESVSNYNKIYTKLSQGKQLADLSIEECKVLVEIGETLYQVYEKTMKMYIYNYYLIQVSSGYISEVDFEIHIEKKIEGASINSSFLGSDPLSIKSLSEWMAGYAEPQLVVYDDNRVRIPHRNPSVVSIPEAEINTDKLRQYAKPAHNDAKHLFDYAPKSDLYPICTDIFPSINNLLQNYCSDSETIMQYGVITENYLLSSIGELFASRNYSAYANYVLLIEKTSDLNDDERKSLLSIPWSMVVDFDQDSQNNGLYKYYDESKSRFILNPAATDNYNFDILYDTYWCFPYGTCFEPSYLVTNDQRWRKSKDNFRNIIIKYYKRNTAPQLLLVLTKSNTDKTKDIIDAYFDVYQSADNKTSSIGIYSICNDINLNSSGYKSSSGYSHYHHVDASPSAFSNYFLQTQDTYLQETNAYCVPVKKGLKNINTTKYPSLEIIYRNISKTEEADINKTDKTKFLIGEIPISWYGIQHDFDVVSISSAEALRDILNTLGEPKSVIKIITHEPGAGGSTFIRRLAYKKSEVQPTLMLKQYAPDQTAKELENLYIDCDKYPICICADSSILTYDQCLQLKSELDATNISHLFVYAHRQGIVKNAWHTIPQLDPPTTREMCEKLEMFLSDTPEDQQRKKELMEIQIVSNRARDRLPLIMSLYTFEEKFQGVEKFIDDFLVTLSPKQKKMLTYAAIADNFANEMLDINLLTEFDPQHRRDLESEVEPQFFKGDSAGIASQKLFTKIHKPNGWHVKIRHPLFSKTIIYKEIGDPANGKQRFYSRLGEYLCDFIRFVSASRTRSSQSNIDLLCNMFITKDQFKLMESDKKIYFGPVIQRIIENVEKPSSTLIIKKIFECLVKEYDDQPHFTAHFGRFYGLIAYDYNKSIAYSKQAIDMSDKDDVLLFHIHAICIRRKIYNLINTASHKNIHESEILRLADTASESFKSSRRNKSIAGYVSDIEMCVKMVDHCKRKSKHAHFKTILMDDKNPYHKYYERAISLFKIIQSTENMLYSKEGNSPSVNKDTKDKLASMLLNLKDTLAYWKRCLDKETDLNTTIQNRNFYVQAALASGLDNLSQTDIESAIRYIEQNIENDYNVSNLFSWFEFIQHIKDKNFNEVLESADLKLREWNEKYPNSIEIVYFLYIIDSLLVINGNNIISAYMNRLHNDLNSLSNSYRDNTSIRRILCSPGKFVSDTSIYKSDIIDSALEIEGIVDSRHYDKDSAIINCNGVKVFFNPDKQVHFTDGLRGKQVLFKLGYTYKGAIALYNSVKDTTESTNIIVQEKICAGIKSRCRVKTKAKGGLVLELVDFGKEEGFIYLSDFPKNKIPKDKNVFPLVVKKDEKITIDKKNYWRMYPEEKSTS